MTCITSSIKNNTLHIICVQNVKILFLKYKIEFICHRDSFGIRVRCVPCTERVPYMVRLYLIKKFN